jgi:glycerophosphoryl diester phosphodiesterase
LSGHPDVLAVAHRAGNHLATLADAVDAGADVLETDVHCRRGRLEVRHEKSAGPLPFYWDRAPAGRVPLLTDRWHVVPVAERSLLLADVLRAAPGARALMLDLKGWGGVGPSVVRALREHAPGVPVLVCARWWPSVDAVATVPGVRPVLSVRSGAELARLHRRLQRGPAPWGVSVHRSLVHPALVARLHEQVERVLTWPVNDDHALETVLRAGVRGVITDEPAVLRAVRSGA